MPNKERVARVFHCTLPAALLTATLYAPLAAHAAAPSGCQLARAPKADFVMQVPFDMIDGRIYVQASVNGDGPFKFAIDTGASGMGRADSSLVSKLGLDLQEPILNSDGVKTAEAATAKIESIDVGGFSRRDLQVITKDYNSRMGPEAAFSGIIAREFFADGLLVIDYPRKLLSFSRTLALRPGQAGVLSYERPLRVPVSIGSVGAVGNLDTGANVTFVFPQKLFEQVSGAAVQQAGVGRLSNSTVETKRSTVDGPILVGELMLTNVDVRVSDTYPELLVGAHALQNATVMVDQRSKTVAVCK